MKSPSSDPLWRTALATAVAGIAPMAAGAVAAAESSVSDSLLGTLLESDRAAWAAATVAQGIAGVAAVAVFILRRRATAREQAATARTQSLLKQADCLLWEAEVRENGEWFDWAFAVQPSGLYRRLFGDRRFNPETGLWADLKIPDQAEMDRHAQQALRTGALGYEQEFRVLFPSATCWLRESVAISPAGPGRWNLVGVITDITPLRAAQEARIASERELQQILHQTACVLWRAKVVRAGDDVRWLSFSVPDSGLSGTLFGDWPELAEGRFWDRYEVPALEENNERARRAILGGAPGYEQEFRVIRDGMERWLHERVSIKVVGVDEWRLAGVITDITPRRRADEAVRASEARFRELLEHAPVAILQADFGELSGWFARLRQEGHPDLAAYLDAHPEEILRAAARVRLLDANDVALRLFRARSKEHLHDRRRRLFARESVAALRGTLLAVEAGHNTFQTETVLRDIAGGRRQIQLRWWLAQREAGLDLTRVAVVLVDLTSLKRAEAELATEKERLAVTLRAMAEAVITTDIEGTVQFINPAAAQLTRKDAAAAVGRPVGELCHFEEEASGLPVSLPIARVARGDAVVDLPLRTCLVAAHQAPRLVEGCCAPIHARDSSVTGIVVVLRDVTERERLEEELVRASRLESVGMLAGGIAHDFNNILTVVLGNLTIALLDAPAGSKNVRVLRAAEQAVLRARDLTQQLLTFARGGDPVRSAVRLPQVVADAVHFALHGSRLRCELDVPPDLWPADADKAQIGRVVQNLVLNAVQAMPAGGTVRIAAGNERLRDLGHPPLLPGDYVRISVTDGGPGIKPEHLGRIFEPYFTTKQSGTGLGLATVYSIVRKHKGHVEVESVYGRGATFHVWLPALLDRALGTADEAVSADPAQPLNARVLFMDDEAPIREMATDILEWLGCEGEMAENGQEAVNRFRIARAQGRPFDVVVMDLTVPGGMGGVETLELLQTMDPQVRVIVSSGYSSDPILANFRAHGFAGRVAKPYDVSEFARVLRDVLGAAGKPADAKA